MTDLQRQLDQANQTIAELRDDISKLEESTHELEKWQFVINQTLVDAGLLKRIETNENNTTA
jgi:predicted  nucleic acid-binding Zn-ribbon protein